MMASTSQQQQTYVDNAVGSNINQASSSSPAIGENGAHHHQQQLQEEPRQQQQHQMHFGSNQSPSDSAAQHQQLFPKSHSAMIPIISSSNNNTIETDIGSFVSGVVDTPPKPLHATVPDTLQQLQYPTTSIAAVATPPAASPSPNTLSLSLDHSNHNGLSNPHFARGEGVKEPLPTDVICGRGKMTSSHPANRRFRELVDSHKASYQNSKRRDEKTRITCELVDKLRGEGRFVLFDPKTKLWHEVSEEYAREKVSHSLRSRSSTEQRIANAASNSIKMLNNAVHHDNDTVVSIAPRMEGFHEDNNSSSGNPMPSVTEEQRATHPTPSKIPDDNETSNSSTNNNSLSSPNSRFNNKTKPYIFNGLATSGNTSTDSSATSSTTSTGKKSSKNNGGASAHQKKNALSTSKTGAHKASSARPKHSLSNAHSNSSHSSSVVDKLKPGLDEIVQRLIKDQQVLLRAMIQKETERFTSAAAMGPPPRQMPLSYKAEASAVSILTDSLPKMGNQHVSAVASDVVMSAAGSVDTEGAVPPQGAAPKSAAPNVTSSSPTTTITA